MNEPTASPGRGGDPDESEASRPVYSIGAVVKMLGVDASTLRAWEERYGLVVPDRSAGGQRLYSRDELANLRFVIDSMSDGASPGDAHRMLAELIRTSGQVAPRSPQSPNVVILLAERDRYAADLAEFLLRTEGYDVHVAFGPDDAMRCLVQRRPQLSIVELMISGGGLRLCRELAGSGEGPILAVSALDLAADALAAGASAFLPKPINPLQLVSTVRDLLGQSALTRKSMETAAP